MSQGLKEVHASDVAAELETQLVSQFRQVLVNRGPGHCMRVSDLDEDLMRRLSLRLRAEVADSLVHVLTGGHRPKSHGDPAGLFITSTKLIELRNPETDGTLRPPLLVFVPNELRTSSEDSFGIATFEDVRVGDVYEAMNRRLVESLPVSMRSAVAAVLSRLSEYGWKWATPAAVTRFLLTIKINDYDEDVVGAALHELALIPDFKLLSDPTKAPYRAASNVRCVEKLTSPEKSERLRVMDLGLSKRAFRAELANFLADVGLENPHVWTRQIIRDRANYRVTYDKWEFEDDAHAPDEVFVEVTDTKLPRVGDDNQDERLSDLIGSLVLPLGKNGLKTFSVAFAVDPKPSAVEGLAKFRLQIVSLEGGPTNIVKNVAAWTTNTSKKTVAFSKLTADSLEEGWHFVRVQALTDDGDRLTLLDRNEQPLPWLDETSSEQTLAPNEGELFYVVPEGDIEVEPVQRAVQRYASLGHAHRDLQFSAVIDDRDAKHVKPGEATWVERGRSSQDAIEVKFGSEGTVCIPVSPQLREIEQRILAEPEQLASWRTSVGPEHTFDPVSDPIGPLAGFSSDDFVAARTKLFDLIRQGDKNLICQATDFSQLKDPVVDYAIEYQTLLQALLRKAETSSGEEEQQARHAIEGLLNLDVVHVTLTNYRGQRQHAAIVGPIHPLRCLWLAGWSALGQAWVLGAAKSRREFVSAARDVLLTKLLPANQPPFLPVGHGSVFRAVENIHPLWTLYAPNLERDSRGLVGNVCAALGLPEPATVGSSVTGKYLAGRIERYLVQHPYVRTLTINVFNGGRAGMLADMLLELQNIQSIADLHYDIRLFVPDSDAPGVGEGLLELLSPEGSVTAVRADAFSSIGRDHLDPKLRVAIRRTDDFRNASDSYPAHISMLFDVFPAEEVSAARFSAEQSGAPVHGLLQDFVLDYIDDGETVAWTRQPRHGHAAPLKGAETVSDLLSSLPAVFSSAIAAVATGQAGVANRPQVTLALDNEDRALIHQVHEVSDWAFTIDRNIGIEYFDHNDQGDRPDYLIEHTPSLENGLGHQVLITSRSLVEIEAMMRSVLERFKLPSDGARSAAILDSLRCLSGRLTLKLISSPTQRSEALGLALSKMYLDHQDIFANQVVISLDAHLELYREPRKHAADVQEEVSLKRTDLALFDLNAATRTITCNLVEVKCYSSTGPVSAYTQLKDSIVEQLETSEKVLRLHFDTKLHSPDRIDRTFKFAEFANLLDFHIQRSVRFGLLDAAAANEARYFARTLEDGYDLRFSRSALIFDFEKPGTDPADTDNGVEFHRVGIDIIQTLVNESVPKSASTGDFTDEQLSDGLDCSGSSSGPRKSPTQDLTSSSASSVPKLRTAAFIAKERDRTVSWDSLASRSSVIERTIKDATYAPPIIESEPIASHDQIVPATVSPEVAPQAVERLVSEIQLNDSPPTAVPPLSTLGSEYVVSQESGVQRTREGEQVTNSGELVVGPTYDVLLGSSGTSPQYGILGEFAGRKIALDLNQTHTISLFGVQGGGKSYTLGTIAEMATMPIDHINSLPSPLATVIFHYSPTQDYRPEFTSMERENTDESAIEALQRKYGARPQSLSDVVLLVPPDKLEMRRSEYPTIQVHPLRFSATELQIGHWQFLMGAIGNQAAYIRQLKNIMRGKRDNLTIDGIRAGVDNAAMPVQMKDYARMRLDMAAQYIDDGERLRTIVRPGRLIIVDLRDEFIEKDEALGLFVVLLQLFGDAKHENQDFNKMIVFDEAHKYIDNPDLVSGLVEVVREMRHKGTSILVASQDPPSVPIALIELSTQIIMHRFNSPAWLKHIQKANAALNSLTAEKMSQLRQGEAYVWSSKSTDESFTHNAVKIQCRPRVTLHGGGTKTAVEQ